MPTEALDDRHGFPSCGRRQFLLVGTPDEVVSELAALLPYVDDLCITAPMGLNRERTAFYQKAIETHLFPSPAPTTSPEDSAA